MIGYIKGTVEGVMSDSILLENNGIGYRIYTSQRTLSDLAGSSKELKLYTYLHVREDELSLFGFFTAEELDTFQLLLGVNGIGPKAALSILSVLSVYELTVAVLSGDVKAITKANGIGAKGANRVIMELRDKLTLDNLLGGQQAENVIGNEMTLGENVAAQDAVLALVQLGYSDTEAWKAVRQIPETEHMNSDAILKEALKKLF